MTYLHLEPGWAPQSAEGGITMWAHEATGDKFMVQDFDVVPNLVCGLDDLGTLRRRVTEQEAAALTTVIELDLVTVGGAAGFTRLVKLPIDTQQPDRPGQTFMAFVTVPKADASTMAVLLAQESQPTGMREAVLMQSLMQQGLSPTDWVIPHPYAPHVQTRLPFHRGDDPRYDAQFPQHPLTRARQWLQWVVATATLDPAFAAKGPYVHR